MSSHLLGLIIGGLCPAVFYALTGVFARLSGQESISVGGYVLAAGIGVSLVGVAALLIEPRLIEIPSANSSRALMHAMFAGLTWGLGTCLLIFAIVKFQSPLAQLAPLYNTNTLLAVLFGLTLLGEWREVSVPKVILAAALIVLGDYVILHARR